MPNKVSALNSTYPVDCEIVRKVRSEYADWIYLIEHGYIRYYKSDGGKLLRKYEHQLVAQAVMGESSKKLHVHHKNKNKLDNRAANLELLTNSDHQKRHKGEQQFVESTCDYCGAYIKMLASQFKKYKAHYCSQSCQRNFYRISNAPTKAELLTDIEELKNWRAVGRKYNVSDNAARKWAKSFGIDPKLYNGAKQHTYKRMFQKTSAYKGVSKRKDRRRWYAHILVNQENISLGTYDAEIEAAKAHDKAALFYFGEDAYLNFPLQSA